jgi:hypothetical protein
MAATFRYWEQTHTVRDDSIIPHHERILDPKFRRAVDLLDAGDLDGLRAQLQQHPDVVRQRVSFEGNYFRNPSLLEFVAENPIRRGKLPANIVEIAKLILDAGASQDSAAVNETLGLVCSGRIARECGLQIALVDLLCDYGADPNYGMRPALPHAEFEAACALLRRGARMELPVAATLGNVQEARRLVTTASNDERQCALALAAQFGHTAIVQFLLDAGADPNRYNPPGTHAHSTPLHQAALAGHFETVRLLVDRGARLDSEDTIWHGTPEGWAMHASKTEVAEYLRAQRREHDQNL